MTVQITAAEIVAIAAEELGYVEPSTGTTKYGKWYGDQVGNSVYDDAPWCDMFVCWCASLAGWRKDGKDGKAQALKQVGQYAYTPHHAGHFAQKSRFNSTPYVGSLAFFDWGGSRRLGNIDHIGLVVGSTKSGEVITIEGNTTQGGRPGVHKRYRNRGTIVGFAHPYYVKASSSAAKPPAAVKSKAPKFPLSAGHWFGLSSAVPGAHSGKTAADKPKVKELQERLDKLGYKLTADGEFGAKTLAAVKSFQRDAHLAADGMAGPATWTALWTTTP